MILARDPLRDILGQGGQADGVPTEACLSDDRCWDRGTVLRSPEDVLLFCGICKISDRTSHRGIERSRESLKKSPDEEGETAASCRVGQSVSHTPPLH